MLVAPVTAPGDVVQDTVWFPPGRWTDFFTGATFSGPTTATIAEPLDRMPVFVKAGGIVPEQPSTVRSTSSPRSLTVKVYPGATGSFTLYNDAGTGLGYTKGQNAETTITTSAGTLVARRATAGRAPVVRASILPTRGQYPGQSRTVDYQLDLVDVSLPSSVTLNGKNMAQEASGATKVGWSYDAHSETAIVDLGPVSGSRTVSVVAVGASSVSQSEPTITSSS